MLRTTKWSIANMTNQSSKTILVTGGNTGMGYQACLELAAKGANVYLAARSETRAQEAIRSIKEKVKDAKVTFLLLDLSDLNQISDAVKIFQKKEPVLDTLINSAGIFIPPFEVTKDGLETHFGVNYVGHYHLTRQLIPSLLKSNEPRLVNVSSNGHYYVPIGGIQFTTIENPSWWNMDRAMRYGQSKLANLLFVHQLTKQYPAIYANSVHPGLVDTNTLRTFSRALGYLYYPAYPFIKIAASLMHKQVDGVATTLYLATSPDIVSQSKKGSYYVQFAKESKPSSKALDAELARKLWDFTEDLIKRKLNT